MANYLFTSESVTEGHPDKICDQISDAILDECLRQDPQSRVACEVLAKDQLIVIAGEISSNAKIDYEDIARNVLKEIGYDDDKKSLDYKTVKVQIEITQQSSDISLGVDNAVESKNNSDELDKLGAGDQGIMFGFACNETDSLMPLPVYLSHKLAKRLSEVRKAGTDFLYPDGKTQVTVEYKDNKPHKVHTVLISTQHSKDITLDKLKDFIIKEVIKKVIPKELLSEDTNYYINPTGRFIIGGPKGDAGLTGRKIIIDTYGGMGRHGGGAFSGKDPSKVDRSGAYAARWIAKNIVAKGFADKCEIQISYAIGMAKPLSIFAETFGTEKITSEKILKFINDNFDLRPAAIIKELDLLKPIYKSTAAYGHFGKENMTWERII